MWLITLSSAGPVNPRSEYVKSSASAARFLWQVGEVCFKVVARVKSSLCNGRSSNVTNLTALPPRPPGLTTKIVFNDVDTRPNPLQVYENVIKALFDLAIQPWDGVLALEDVALILTGNTFYSILAEVPYSIRTNYVVQATVEFLTAMRERGWYTGVCGMHLNTQRIAIIGMGGIDFRMRHPLHDPGHSNITYPSFPFNGNDDTTELAGNVTTTDPWREIVSPRMLDDHIIRWRYDGENIRSEELFLMFVDGLTEAAQHHHRARCVSMDAVSPSGNAVFYMGSDSRTTGASHLYWYHVAATISALALEALVPARRFAEIEFELDFMGIPLAKGYILKRSSTKRVGDGGETATS